MIEDQFIGAWRLVSLTVFGPDGRAEPHGPDPIGTLLYTPDHRFSAALAKRDLPRIDPAELPTPQDSVAAMQGFVAYFGEWELDEGRTAVIHKAEWASWGRLLDANQVRHYEFDGDRLTLRTPEVEADGMYGEVIFQRY